MDCTGGFPCWKRYFVSPDWFWQEFYSPKVSGWVHLLLMWLVEISPWSTWMVRQITCKVTFKWPVQFQFPIEGQHQLSNNFPNGPVLKNHLVHQVTTDVHKLQEGLLRAKQAAALSLFCDMYNISMKKTYWLQNCNLCEVAGVHFVLSMWLVLQDYLQRIPEPCWYMHMLW